MRAAVVLDVKGSDHLHLNGEELSMELVGTKEYDEYKCYSGNVFLDGMKLQELASSMASFSPTR